MPIFGYSERAVEAARREGQQDVLDKFLNSVRFHRGHDKGRESLLEMIREWRLRGRSSPWYSELADRLVERIDRLIETKNDLDRKLSDEQWRRERLEQELKEYRRDPLQKQVRTLTKECNQWCDEATRLRDRVQQLERDLERCQQRYRNETQHFQKRLNELNSLVVRQQERLQTLQN